jgi:membrane protein
MRGRLPLVVGKGAALVACRIRNWLDDNATTLGAALAFYCAFSLAPLLVILLGLTEVIVGAAAATAQLNAQMSALVGPATSKILSDAVTSSRQAQGIISTLISVVTLLISATTVLAALNAALEQIWKTPTVATSGWRGWIRTRFLSFGFILALGFLLLASLTISTGLATLEHRILQPTAGSQG